MIEDLGNGRTYAKLCVEEGVEISVKGPKAVVTETVNYFERKCAAAEKARRELEPMPGQLAFDNLAA